VRLDFTATPAVQRVVDGLRRTEDICFSPGGRKLAVAEFAGDRIVILDVEIATAGTSPRVALTDWMEITSSGFRQPHGVCFLDEETLIVANRGGGVSLLKVPSSGGAQRTFVVPALDAMHGSRWVHSPGSVAVSRLDSDRCALFVCNNYADHVSRHILKGR
jgi:hypothetical protein